ncbi:hypothetical protein NQ318_007964, partial [Aromia moschata]
FVKDAYQNGTHIMDSSSLDIIDKSLLILEKGFSAIDSSKLWMVKYILDYNIWEKQIEYKDKQLGSFAGAPDFRILQNMMIGYKNSNNRQPSTDFCLQDIVNQTLELTPNLCYINLQCWKMYYVNNEPASGYTLTHELLLIQLAKARKCITNENEYVARTKHFCELIYAEVFNGDYFDILDEIFDLFLEESSILQLFFCGYEGYTDFFKHKWLFYILKSQKPNGCFSAILEDNLKTRIKRDTNIFEDGCADHTTGLGAAVLSLYYNYIIKNDIENLM